MRILGIDPGSRITGYGVIESRGGRLVFIDCGTVRTASVDFPQRLGQIFHGIGTVVATHDPQEVAVESIFMHRNADSALKLGHARGAAICAVLAHTLPVYEYAARQVKQAVVGRGAADKAQVQFMARRLLSMPANMDAALDASDALAVAICHAHTRATAQRLVLHGGST